MSRRMGAVGVVGMTAVLVAGCGNETPKPTQTVDATLKPTELYDHRVAVQRGENLIVCFTDQEPFRDDVEWAFVADSAYCPDIKANLIFLNEEGPVISPFRLDIRRGMDNFEHANQKALRDNGEDIPPPLLTE